MPKFMTAYNYEPENPESNSGIDTVERTGYRTFADDYTMMMQATLQKQAQQKLVDMSKDGGLENVIQSRYIDKSELAEFNKRLQAKYRKVVDIQAQAQLEAQKKQEAELAEYKKWKEANPERPDGGSPTPPVS